jgi:hypothetical protein
MRFRLKFVQLPAPSLLTFTVYELNRSPPFETAYGLVILEAGGFERCDGRDLVATPDRLNNRKSNGDYRSNMNVIRDRYKAPHTQRRFPVEPNCSAPLWSVSSPSTVTSCNCEVSVGQ